MRTGFVDRIDYGPVSYNVIRTLKCERTGVYDVVGNYLYTHWDCLFEVNYQPSPIHAAYVAPALFTAPVATPGTLPGVTDVSTLVPLLQPRQLLRLTAGGTVILETPSRIEPNGQRYACDVTGRGPTVDLVGVPMMVGNRHWVVTLHIQADARDRRQTFPQGRSAIISNTWVCTEDIDYQRRSVRRFAGRAILRADVMRLATSNANTYRDLYLFACPNHYKRQNVQVQISQDGTIADWSFEDVMQGYDLGVGSPIVRIECFRTGSVQRGSPLKFLVDVARGVGRAGSLLGTVPAFIAAVFDNLPRSWRQCRCDLIGDRNANIGVLSGIAMGVCLHHNGVGIGQLVSGSQEITFRQDIGDQVYTSCEITTTYTDEAILNAAGALFNNMNVDRIANWQNHVPNIAQASAIIGQQLTTAFTQLDSRNLRVVIPAAIPGGAPPVEQAVPANQQQIIIASRQGDSLGPVPEPGGNNLSWGQNNNPPLRQSAFGVVPQNVVGTIPPRPVAADVAAIGSIPIGIEHLIVQALLGENFALGQNESPPEPTDLTTDS